MHLVCEAIHSYQDETSDVHKPALLAINVGPAGNSTIQDRHDEAWDKYNFDDPEVSELEITETLIDGEPAIMSEWEKRGMWSSHYIVLHTVIDGFNWNIWSSMTLTTMKNTRLYYGNDLQFRGR